MDSHQVLFLSTQDHIKLDEDDPHSDALLQYLIINWILWNFGLQTLFHP